MNGSYYKNPTFPEAVNNTNDDEGVKIIENDIDFVVPKGKVEEIVLEQMTLNSILKVNYNNTVTIYTSFPDSMSMKDKTFFGTIKCVGRDDLIIYNDNLWYVIPIKYINYFEFTTLKTQ